ncbi:hypothetical protein CcCBS67573_g01215 [Chytriomyces confervae]|uniref:Uncharacterized protein n=1 Tax=Chytriomyces confervae TaxID=246404 RepID=A0A507FM72_9FUNG|nr:hypothetical protein CcCBS67573_g01215 [Chytriomyces confervae]
MRSSIRVKSTEKENEEEMRTGMSAKTQTRTDSGCTDEHASATSFAWTSSEPGPLASASSSTVPPTTALHEVTTAATQRALAGPRLSRSSSALLDPLEHSPSPVILQATLPAFATAALPAIASNNSHFDTQPKQAPNSAEESGRKKQGTDSNHDPVEDLDLVSFKQSLSFDSLSSAESYQTAVVSLNDGVVDEAATSKKLLNLSNMAAFSAKQAPLTVSKVDASFSGDSVFDEMYINSRPHRGTSAKSRKSTPTTCIESPTRISTEMAASTANSKSVSNQPSLKDSCTETKQPSTQSKGTSTFSAKQPLSKEKSARDVGEKESTSSSVPKILSRTASGFWNPLQNLVNAAAASLASVGGSSSITLYESDSHNEDGEDDDTANGVSENLNAVQGMETEANDRGTPSESASLSENSKKKKKKNKNKNSKKHKKKKSADAEAAATSNTVNGSLPTDETEETGFITVLRRGSANSGLASKSVSAGKHDSASTVVSGTSKSGNLDMTALESFRAVPSDSVSTKKESDAILELDGVPLAEKLCLPVSSQQNPPRSGQPALKVEYSKAYMGASAKSALGTTTSLSPHTPASVLKAEPAPPLDSAKMSSPHEQLPRKLSVSETKPYPSTKPQSASAKYLNSTHVSSALKTESETLPEIPQWQKLVISSHVSTVYYADLIDEVIRTLGYKLVSICRKPDSYPQNLAFGHSRRIVAGQESFTTEFTPPCTKGSLHLYLQRTESSTPLTSKLGLEHLRTYMAKQMQHQSEGADGGISSRPSSARTNAEVSTVKERQHPGPIMFSVSREQDPHINGLFSSDLRSLSKSHARLQRAELFGCYVGGLNANGEAALPPGGVQIPQVLCVLARGGFGVPVMRTLLKKKKDGLEFLGLRYVKALLPFQARIVTPYGVCDPKWAASCRFLSAGCADVYGEGVANEAFEGHEEEDGGDNKEENGDNGYMIIVLRKVNAFQEVDGFISSFIDSYSSLGLDAGHGVHDESALTSADKLHLSLLVSQNPEMAYATLTSFFRDSDLIPERWVGALTGPSAHIKGLTSPDDPEVISNPTAIPLSLICPPRGHHALLLLKGSSCRCLGSLLDRLILDSGLVLTSVRFMSLSSTTAGKLVSVNSDLVTRWDVNESFDEESNKNIASGSSDVDYAGVGLDGLLKWATSTPLCMLVVWGVSATRRVHEIMSEFSVHRGITKPSLKLAEALSRGSAVLSQDFYVPNNFGIGQYQISVLCPKGFPIEVREFPRQLGTFQRKLIPRRLSMLPVHERRLQPSGFVAAVPPTTTLSTLIMTSVYPTFEANMVEWNRILAAVMQTTGSQQTHLDGSPYQRSGPGNDKSAVAVVGMSYFVATEPLAMQISECIDGSEGARACVNNILNGPCFAIVFEGGRDAETNLSSIVSGASIRDQAKLVAVLTHEKSMAFVPLVVTELAATSGYRLGFSNPSPSALASPEAV